MTCPKCNKKFVVYIDKIDFACIVVWGKCSECIKKQDQEEIDEYYKDSPRPDIE
ncbi:MAG: hypothetical protein ACTSPD_10020 [Promethearchaeota archaeon]